MNNSLAKLKKIEDEVIQEQMKSSVLGSIHSYIVYVNSDYFPGMDKHSEAPNYTDCLDIFS